MLQQLNKYYDFGLLFLRLAVGAIFIVQKINQHTHQNHKRIPVEPS
jgi:hypothetical protein